VILHFGLRLRVGDNGSKRLAQPWPTLHGEREPYTSRMPIAGNTNARIEG
jgi:hypothetical protein